MPAGILYPRVEDMGLILCPWRMEGAGTGFASRARVLQPRIRGHFTRCHLYSRVAQTYSCSGGLRGSG
jgi:hypothetical protein